MRKTDPANVQQQRDQIIKGALKCFARKGVHGSTTDDIARSAKVSPGKLYYYFKSRDGLMHDVIQYAHRSRDHLLRDLSEQPDLLAALIDMQSRSVKVIAAQGVPTEVYLELLAYSTRNSAAKQAFEESGEQVIAIISEAVVAHQAAGKLRSDISADVLTRFITTAVMGMSLAEVAHGQASQRDFRATLALLVTAPG